MNKPPLIENAGFIILMFFCFFPIGLVFMWLNPRWGRQTKIAITSVFAIFFLGIAIYNQTPAGKAAAAQQARDQAQQDAQAAAETRRDEAAQAKKDAADKAAAQAAGEQLTDIGDVGVLHYADDPKSDVLMADSKDDLNKLMDAISAKDTVGEQQLIAGGQAFFVPAGTRAKLLDLDGLGVFHIRLASGDRDTQEAWVNMEALRK